LLSKGLSEKNILYVATTMCPGEANEVKSAAQPDGSAVEDTRRSRSRSRRGAVLDFKVPYFTTILLIDDSGNPLDLNIFLALQGDAQNNAVIDADLPLKTCAASLCTREGLTTVTATDAVVSQTLGKQAAINGINADPAGIDNLITCPAECTVLQGNGKGKKKGKKGKSSTAVDCSACLDNQFDRKDAKGGVGKKSKKEKKSKGKKGKKGKLQKTFMQGTVGAVLYATAGTLMFGVLVGAIAALVLGARRRMRLERKASLSLAAGVPANAGYLAARSMPVAHESTPLFGSQVNAELA
jgi:hypothetical protein